MDHMFHPINLVVHVRPVGLREERELLDVEGDGLADVAPTLPVLERSEEEAARRLRAVRAACVCVGWGRRGRGEGCAPGPWRSAPRTA